MSAKAKREYVYKAWEHSGVLKSGDCFIGWIHESRAARYCFGSWDAAFAFTKERERQIAEIEEEIAYLKRQDYRQHVREINDRIVEREQAALQEIRRGMRKEGERNGTIRKSGSDSYQRGNTSRGSC